MKVLTERMPMVSPRDHVWGRMKKIIKIQKKTTSMDFEYDEEGTTMKDFIREEEDYSYLHEIHAKKADIMKGKISQLKNPYKKFA